MGPLSLFSAMLEFVSAYPGTALAVGSLLLTLLAASFGLIAKLLSDREKRTTDALARAIEDLRDTMHEALAGLRSTISGMDARQDRLIGEAFTRIGATEQGLANLKGEHDAHKAACNMLYQAQPFDRRHPHV